MKKALITGATGMIGSIVLRECVQSNQIKKVISITRRSSGAAHPKVEEVIHNDFSDYTPVEKYFEHVDAAYFCIGVYTGQVNDVDFKKITVDFAKTFANTLKQHSPNAVLSFLSGAGADRKEKSRMAFAKYKGIAENYLITKDLGGLYIFRPAYIYPVEKREEPNIAYRFYRRLYPLMKNLLPSSTITSEQLGKAMFLAALNGTEKTILENEDIKAIL